MATLGQDGKMMDAASRFEANIARLMRRNEKKV
jgi:hypothetical protein